MNNVDRIIKARDYSLRYGADGTARGFILAWRAKLQKERGVVLQVKGLDKPSGKAVEARVWQGQWVAECEDCGGNEFVDPEEPLFFCFGCGNRGNGSNVRPVIIPERWREIEAALLARPVHDKRGITELERAGLARAAVVVVKDGVEMPLVRSWTPGETVEELLAQNLVLDGLRVDERDTTVVMVGG